MAPEDAAEHHIADGDLARVESVRGHVEVPARCAGTKPGSVFLPFHYGNFDPTPSNGNGAAAESESSGHSVSERPRAANELTLTAWDPVSKQPTFKSGAVRITRLDDTPDPARKET